MKPHQPNYLVIIGVVFLVRCGTATSSTSGLSSEIAPVIAAEREWADVVKNRDRTRAEAILADEFILTGPVPARVSTRQVTTKEVWLENLARITVTRFELIEPHVVIHGETAVATLRAKLDWSIGDRKLPSDYLLTDVWVRRGGRWQVVLRVSEPK